MRRSGHHEHGFDLLSDSIAERIMQAAGLCATWQCKQVSRRFRRLARRNLNLAYPEHGLVKAIGVVESMAWPFELAQSVSVHERTSAIQLELHGSSRLNKPEFFRLYLYRPHTYVQWSLVQNYDDSLQPTPASGIGPEQVDYTESAWVRITYVLFNSKLPGDDARINKLRKMVRTHGLRALSYPELLRPNCLFMGALDELGNPIAHQTRPPAAGESGFGFPASASFGPASGASRAADSVRRTGDNAMAWWAGGAHDWFETALPFRRLEITEPRTSADLICVLRDGAQGVEDYCKPSSVQITSLHHLHSRIPTYRELALHLLMYVECFQGVLFKRSNLFEAA